jgi:hypothetical protein
MLLLQMQLLADALLCDRLLLLLLLLPLQHWEETASIDTVFSYTIAALHTPGHGSSSSSSSSSR